MNLLIEIPKVTPWGTESRFRELIETGEKRNLFISNPGNDYFEKILFFEKDINGRVPFNVNYNAGDAAIWDTMEDNWPEKKWEADRKKPAYYPTHEEALPFAYCWEKFTVIFHVGALSKELNQAFIHLAIGGQFLGTITFSGPILALTDFDFTPQINISGRILEVLEASAVGPADFVRWVAYKTMEQGSTILEGFVIHWGGKPFTENAVYYG
jgi:hypothetical protein